METNTLEPRGADIRNELEFAPSDSYTCHVSLLSVEHIGASQEWRSMSLSISCLWALMGAFIYMVTLNLHWHLQSGCYYFQVTGEHMIFFFF